MTRSRGFQLPRTTALLVLTVFTLLPFAFMVVTSFKDNGQFYHSFLSLDWPLHPENYVSAWQAVGGYVANSLLITGVSTLGVVVVASLAAYAFARFDFPAKSVLFYAVLSVVMVPFVLTLIPQFTLLRDLGVLDSYLAYILPYVAGGQVLAIFILRNFFAGLPNDLFESARIDGASELLVLRHIALPLAKPALGTVAIIQALDSWNDIVWPTIVGVNDNMRTIAVGLSVFSDASRSQFGPLFAGYVIAALPLFVLFLLTMRSFVAGVTSGAVRQ